ncbi:MAG: sugar phosphate nucleotidyltransferase [Rickettsiales bacterium]|nr:sugar phosphate nucleotidyltransferase [Rickettsiales bacterium]
MTKITQAFIFAAGRGERMRPITDKIPKPLVKIKNKAIIDYTIEKLNQISTIKKIIVNGFYLADEIEKHLKKLNNPKIIFSREVEKVETGGGLLFALDKIDINKPLLTVNGDILWQEKSITSDIELISESWESKEHDILLGLKKTEDYIGYDGNSNGGGDFDFSAGKLFRFPNQALSHVYVGLQIINPKILLNAKNEISQNCFSMSHFYKSAIGESGMLHRVGGVELKGKYFHIGTVEAIATTEKILESVFKSN